MLNTQKLYVIDENGFFYEKLEDLYHMSWNLCPHSSTANILKVNLRQAKYLKRKVLFWAKSCRRTLPIFRKMTLRSQISYLAGICSLLLVLSRATFIISIISFFIYIFACARSHPIFGSALRHPDWRYDYVHNYICTQYTYVVIRIQHNYVHTQRNTST